jgi:hypothetical protein
MGREAGGAFSLFYVALAIVVIVTVAWISGFMEKADARANIQDYLKGPNLFYPSGYDRPGPMNLTIQTVGWNVTRIAGNVGIGNGSVRTFDRTSTYDVEYPVNEFMCGDVSTQPWIPGLKTEAPQTEAAAEENATGEVTGEPGAPGAPEENVTAPEAGTEIISNTSRFAIQPALQNGTNSMRNETYNRTGEGAFNRSGRTASNATNVTNATNATNKTAPDNLEQARAAAEGPIYDAYHPIQYLRPVKDILYEHPLSTSGTAYCMLLGFETPAGDLVNVGMKCTGYGY